MSAIRNTFLSNLLLVVGLNLLIKPLYVLVVEAHVQDRLGPEEFGLYFALLNLSFVFNIIPDLGMSNWNNRITAQWGFIPAGRVQRLGGIRLLLGVAYILICLLPAIILDYNTREVYLLLLLAFNQVVATGIQFLRSFLSGLHDFKSDSLLSVLDKALLMLFVIVLLYAFPSSGSFQLEYLIYAQSAAYLLAFAVAAALVLRRQSSRHEPTSLVSSTVLRESAPFALLILLSMFANRQDGILLERLHSAHEAGIYAMAYRLGDTLNMFAFLFAGLLLPMFSRLLEAKKSITPLFDLSAKLLLAGAWTVTVSTLFYPELIMNILYDGHTAEAATVLPWVMMSAFLFSMQYVTGTLITASGNMRTLILLAGGGMLYNLLLNVLYVPEQGALGAAKAACFMQFIVLVGQIIHVQVNYRTFGRNLSLKLLPFLVIAPVVATLLRLTETPEYIQLVAMISICFFVAFGLKMIDLTDLRMLLQQREPHTKDTTENS